MAKAAFFYEDGGLVASTYPGWLQSAFDKLMRLFDQVGLGKNIRKTVGVGIQAMPGSQGAVRRGLHTEDDGGMTEFSNRYIRNGCYAQSAVRNWQMGKWWRNTNPRMA